KGYTQHWDIILQLNSNSRRVTINTSPLFEGSIIAKSCARSSLRILRPVKRGVMWSIVRIIMAKFYAAKYKN
ncbi:hypothetical protein D3OALGB2SA_1989, partial [Olavius algarvensis associated proteobacterium Delta 3]